MQTHIARYGMLSCFLAVCFSYATSTPACAQVKEPVTDPAGRLAFYEQHMEMRENTPYDLSWRFIGPQIMSGRITDLAVPNGQPYTIYIASASGGVWKTINEGTTWQPIFDDAPSASVGAIACAPSDPNTVWVGLGESNIFRSSMSGTGVYKSNDAGKTWQHMGLADTHHIARIVIHPENPNVVFVAACGHEWTNNEERGVFRTTDGGETWERVHYINQSTGAIDLVMSPDNPQVLYASMWDRIRLKWSDPLPGQNDGIYKSTDGGDTWTELSEGLPTRTDRGRTGIAIAASNPDVLYALIDSHEIERKAEPGERDAYGNPRADIKRGAEVYRSDDAGATWSLMSGDADIRRLFSTYGWVFGQVRVDPNDENTIYVMGVPMMRSRDGGKSFERVNYAGLHGDHHAMWIDPENSNHIINGNDGGLNISYDGGDTWKNIEDLPLVQFYNLAYDMAEPFNLYGSIQDNGSWTGSVAHDPRRDPGTDWKPTPGGEASYHAVDPSDPNVLYCEGFYGSIQRATLNPREIVNIRPREPEGEPSYRGQWLAPFIISPHNPYVIYHGMNKVFRSVDRGDNWEVISPDLSYNDPEKQGNIPFQTMTSLSESPITFGLLYAGTDDGRVWGTRNGGDDWNELTSGTSEVSWVSRVVASKYDEATVYLAKNGKRDNDFQAYLYKSTDFGQTWQDISNNLPGGPINVIKEDPRSANVLYVGTDLGVYISSNGGESWEVLGTGLPNTFVHDLIIHPRDDIVVIATHGRGMFALELEEIRGGLGGSSQSDEQTDN